MQTFTIPSTISLIEVGAFSNCTGLRYLQIGNGGSNIINLERSVFSGCTGLTKTIINNEIYTSYNNNFESCTGELIINSVLPNKVGYDIGWNNGEGYFDYSNFSKISINDGINYIGEWVFAHIETDEFIIGKDVESIGAQCFNNCSIGSIKSAEDSKLETIGEYTFYNANIGDIQIPTIKTIEFGAFISARITSSLVFNGNIHVEGGAFSSSHIDTLIIRSIKGIDDLAFSGAYCDELTLECNTPNYDMYKYTTAVSSNNSPLCHLTPKNIIISDNVTTIGEYTFDTITDSNKGATPTITIGKNVKTIGKGAFHVIGDISPTLGDDSTPGKVYCKPITPPELDATDNFVAYNIYVPRESLELYKDDKEWYTDTEYCELMGFGYIYGYDF